jgi:hypothetical protein
LALRERAGFGSLDFIITRGKIKRIFREQCPAQPSFLIMAGLIAALVIGCSKHSDGNASQTEEVVEEPATNAAVTNGAATNDLLATALKTHTKQAWLNELHQEIQNDPNIDAEM